MDNIDVLVQEIIKYIKKIKGQVMSIDNVSEILKEKLGDEYYSEIGISVKSILREHEALDFFREGDYCHEQKYYYCVGNWLSMKGLYSNAIEAKSKIGLLSWQRFEDDWED
ncbi:hypothetical protein [Viridibacillus arvi]|uniref:hypothetical protein n=1 Tax=Viridibacillus arvi TaxID=263475 RepID=UPI0034CE6049